MPRSEPFEIKLKSHTVNKHVLTFMVPGTCGSCYAFASMAMNEARVRIMTNNSQQPVFSPQDIVECSEYSQGKRHSVTLLTLLCVCSKYSQGKTQCYLTKTVVYL